MFAFLKTLFGGRRRRWKHDFGYINRRLGPWESQETKDPVRGTRLPKRVVLPDWVERFGDQPGSVSFSRAFFPYWLRIEPALAALLVRRIREGKLYRESKIPKKSGGEFRIIHAPEKILKNFQRIILSRYLEQIEVHEAAHGFVKGRSIFSAVRPHCGKRVVVSLDLEDFFGTVTFRRVAGLFCAYGLEKKPALLLAGLCCRDGKLPQGAPTSPMIANIVCRKLDARLTGFAIRHNFAYTRYADDLIFSGEDPLIGFIGVIKKIIQEEGFAVAGHKLKIRRSGSRQQVLGLNVNSCVSVPRKVRRLLRAMADRQLKAQKADDNMYPFLMGHASFMKPVHPEEAQRLKKMLKDIY